MTNLTRGVGPQGEMGASERLVALGVLRPFAEELEASALACGLALERWSAALEASDVRDLVRAYHRAESLAELAIEQARQQSRHEGRRSELTEQLCDERAHIDVFARWLEEDCEPVEPPSPPAGRQRPELVWWLLLMANEVAGYCQFSMLAHTLGDSSRRSEVAQIMRDEERHVARLAGWLRPMWQSRSARLLHGMVDRFCADLPGRMCQFFPRSGLQTLRNDLAASIERALRAVPRA